MSDKSEKFRKVAERRTNGVLKALRLLGQCSNPRIYQYSEDETKKIFREVDKELRSVKASFDTSQRDPQFRLD